MRPKIKRAILELGAGIICSFVGCFGMVEGYELLLSIGVQVDFGGCRSSVFLGLLGSTIGSLAGVLVVNKAVFKMPGWNVQGLIVGFVFAGLAAFVGLFGAVQLGLGFYYCLPVLPTVASCLGFRMKLLVRQEDQKL